LSGGCGASGVAATVPQASTALITDSHVLMYARLMKMLLDLQADRVRKFIRWTAPRQAKYCQRAARPRRNGDEE
jgi:hypothetical protein